jgi:5S rRNA maturation endonuclease (ribonuclease M5)
MFPPVEISTPAARAKGEVIVVESQGCALALMGAGIDNVITLFGVKLSSKVIGRIVALAPRHVIIATNNEASGIGNRAAEDIREVLSSFVSPEHIEIRLPPVKDFGVMSERDPTYASILAWYAPAAAPVAGEPATETPAS